MAFTSFLQVSINRAVPTTQPPKKTNESIKVCGRLVTKCQKAQWGMNYFCKALNNLCRGVYEHEVEPFCKHFGEGREAWG